MFLDRLLGIGYEAGQIAPPDVALHEDPPPHRVSADLCRAFFDFQLGKLCERDLPAERVGNHDTANSLDVVAPLGRKTYLQRESPLPVLASVRRKQPNPRRKRGKN